MTDRRDEPQRLAVVTGGTSGIGLATATQLAQRGFRLVLVGRDRGHGERAVQEMSAGGAREVEFESADLSSIRQTRDLARRILTRHDRIHLLVNNMGGQYADRRLSEDGLEATFATNVVTPLLLTQELLPTLRASAPARVVFVNSDAHRFARLVVDDLNSERSYRGLTAHARAKLVQALVVRELGRRLDGSGVSVVLVNPGGAWTTQTAAMTPGMVSPVMRLWWPLMRMVQRRRTPEQAGAAVVAAATVAAPAHGIPMWIDENGHPSEPARRARDDAAAASLYERIEVLLDRARDAARADRLTGP
jgi:NAD(P)-dependent dehydrogenase (short-subunit alcohol dehydrogenase family)